MLVCRNISGFLEHLVSLTHECVLSEYRTPAVTMKFVVSVSLRLRVSLQVSSIRVMNAPLFLGNAGKLGGGGGTVV